MSTKPIRILWVKENDYNRDISESEPPDSKDYWKFKVIEYSAYHQASEELEAAREENASLHAELKKIIEDSECEDCIEIGNRMETQFVSEIETLKQTIINKDEFIKEAAACVEEKMKLLQASQAKLAEANAEIEKLKSEMEFKVQEKNDGLFTAWNTVERDNLKLKDKLAAALEYCDGRTDQMWAAVIVGALLGCDFRDSEAKLREWKGKL